jgi:glycosyltransferase involved in cell wall biosynthesis
MGTGGISQVVTESRRAMGTIDLTPYERDPRIRVSVLMITYNHAPFVAQAIDSVLAQEAPFDYELVIGDDCSTDGTRTIVQEYASRYPDRMRVLARSENLGMQRNMIDTLRSCRGQYIALLEGDDYWTYQHKLNEQIALLDAHPEAVGCFHNVNYIRDGQLQMGDVVVSDDCPATLTAADFLVHFRAPTCSIVFRNGTLTELPSWILNSPAVDKPLSVLLAQHGHFAYLNQTMGAYRVHNGGVWSTRNVRSQARALIDMTEHLNRDLDYRYDGVVAGALLNHWLGVVDSVVATVRDSGFQEQLVLDVVEEIQGHAGTVAARASQVGQILGTLYFNIALIACQAGNSGVATRYLKKAMVSDPRFLLNRGAWAIAWRATRRQLVCRAA